jgi:hypothetical protein
VGDYKVVLRLRHDQQHDVDLLDVASFEREGRDVRGEVLGDDPFVRPPLSGNELAEVVEILKQVQAANRAWWFERPNAAVDTLGYDFNLRGERKSYLYEKAKEPYDHWTAHGLSYSPAVAMVCGAPARLALRQVEKGPEQIRIAYTVKQPVGYSAGNGVSGSWYRFVSGKMRSGLITLDAKRLVPLEHRFNDGDVEEFADYAELPDGSWAPRRIRFRHEGRPWFDWTFDVYEPGVWLFTKSTPADDSQAEPIATLEKPVINGEPAKRLP